MLKSITVWKSPVNHIYKCLKIKGLLSPEVQLNIAYFGLSFKRFFVEDLHYFSASRNLSFTPQNTQWKEQNYIKSRSQDCT